MDGEDQGGETGLAWYPAVGAVLGAFLVVADYTLRQALGTMLSSAVEIMLLLLLTGGLHADGLIDVADGVFSHATSDRRLEIMRDPRAGSFGVLAAISVLLIKFAALASLDGYARSNALLLMPIIGRAAIVQAAFAFPYGRRSGMGAAIKMDATRKTFWIVAAVTLTVVLLCAQLSGVLLLLVVAAFGLTVGRWLVRLLPGLTGDCYGAICELSEMMVVVLAVLIVQRSQGG